MTVREQVLNEALALSPEDRAYLADHLELSLNTGELASPELAALWSAEIDRRMAAYERGALKAANADDAMTRIRQYLDQHRLGRTNP